MTCPDCGSDKPPRQTTVEPLATGGRWNTVTFCPDCEEVLDAGP